MSVQINTYEIVEVSYKDFNMGRVEQSMNSGRPILINGYTITILAISIPRYPTGDRIVHGVAFEERTRQLYSFKEPVPFKSSVSELEWRRKLKLQPVTVTVAGTDYPVHLFM